MNLFDLQQSYDMIMVGGDMLTLISLTQLNMLFDNDLVAGTDSVDTATAGNLLWNEAKVTWHGVDSEAEMSAESASALGTLDAGNFRLDALAEEPLLSNQDVPMLLTVSGNLVIDYRLEQINVLTDADTVQHIVDSAADKGIDPVSVSTGDNILANVATLDIHGTDSAVMASDGVYSDVVIYQAGMYDTDAAPLGADPAGLASEAVAFLAERWIGAGARSLRDGEWEQVVHVANREPRRSRERTPSCPRARRTSSPERGSVPSAVAPPDPPLLGAHLRDQGIHGAAVEDAGIETGLHVLAEEQEQEQHVPQRNHHPPDPRPAGQPFHREREAGQSLEDEKDEWQVASPGLAQDQREQARGGEKEPHARENGHDRIGERLAATVEERRHGEKHRRRHVDGEQTHEKSDGEGQIGSLSEPQIGLLAVGTPALEGGNHLAAAFTPGDVDHVVPRGADRGVPGVNWTSALGESTPCARLAPRPLPQRCLAREPALV